MSNVLEYYGATWCKVCVTVKPAMQKLAADFGVQFMDYDIDELEGDERVATITKVPTVRIYQDGALIDTIVTKHMDAVKALLSKSGKVVLTDDF